MDDDRSETNSGTAVITVALLHRTVARLKQRYPTIGKIVDGTPIVLMQEGQLRTDLMSKMGVQEADLIASARTNGVKALEDVEYAILERNGGISVIKR